MSAPTTTPTTNVHDSRDQQLSGWNATLLVAEREILTQVRSKSFLVSNAITLLLIVGGIILASVIGSNSDPGRVAVVGTPPAALEQAEDLEIVESGDQQAAESQLRAEEVEAVIVADDSELGYRVIALSEEPTDVVNALAVRPDVELLDPASASEGLRSLIAIAFGLVFMMATIGSGMMIMQNTIQEKQSRIVEILLAAVPARALLGGKILGNSVIGVASAIAMAAAAALGLLVTGQGELLSMISAPLIWFVVFFVFGFVLVASVFAAGASLVSRQEDAGSVMTPAMMMVMIPYFGAVFFADNPVVMTILSYVPFSAPVAMPVRMFLGEAQWWEPMLALGLLAACTVGVVAIAARIYTGSLLRTGSRVKVSEALGRK
ncbi:ABC transporter permease [Epidermidibacterium keratini]|uniref:ABC transporter permease n=1 Tax=Epidermidibacterium keratini TaxID=1891644 RepID=A0A7L4YQ02_9ACTN|nr:ABC transporter permease [Epidermidibacterium keratini]QHC01148.1 ABC transporter permease [Epidermidibacterium keratini]